MWLALLHGVSFATAPLLSFGPFKIFVLSSAVDQGWRKSLPLALAPLIADAPIIVLVWFILNQFPDWTINGLRILGALFYVYLAVGLIRRSNRSIDAEAVVDAPSRSFWQAITAIWISPQVYLNWSVIGVPALLAYAESSIAHVAAFLAGFYLLWVCGLAAQIVIFGQVGKVNQNATRMVLLGASLLLIGFAVYQGWLGVSNLLSS
jgi:threonine/homoserine/homoserine lactone efflux protein